MEKTLVLIKPDAVQRGFIGRVIARIEDRGLQIIGAKMLKLSEEMVTNLYPHQVDKDFFPRLKNFMTSAPVIALAVQGDKAIEATRKLLGKTNPLKAEMGTIRGDWALTIGANLVHCSDASKTAERELDLFFNPEEILNYPQATGDWLREEPWEQN